MQSERIVLDNFVVLEGLDGAGTTTQSELLANRLRAEGARVLSTCEPSRGAVGTLIRSILRRELPVDPCTLALLFAADRNEHLYASAEGVVQRLSEGQIVVCDRYLFSSLAYQTSGCGWERVSRLNEPFPLPRYLIFLDVTPVECQRRLSSRSGVELFDDAGIQEEILANYERAMASASGGRMELIRIDGEEPTERVAEKIWRSLASLPIH